MKFVEGTNQETATVESSFEIHNSGLGTEWETQIFPPGAPKVGEFNAKRLNPSAEEATPCHDWSGRLLEIQLRPKFVEV
jgi:hypothetical protein